MLNNSPTDLPALLAERIAQVRQAIAESARAAGRDPAEVELLAVTKTQPVAVLAAAVQAGLRAVGENRVQEAAAKKNSGVLPLRWELIGHLQSNKARLAVEVFDRIQSVDSQKLLTHLAQAAAGRDRLFPVLLQINAGNDPAKFGAEPADAEALLMDALGHAQLRVDGLMTVAPLGATPGETREHSRRTFSRLREIRDDLAARVKIPLPVLSMGMSGDFAEAIAAGSTLVRIGTALFGARPPTG